MAGEINNNYGLRILKNLLKEWTDENGKTLKADDVDLSNIFSIADAGTDGIVDYSEFEKAAAEYYKEDIANLENEYISAYNNYVGSDGASYSEISDINTAVTQNISSTSYTNSDISFEDVKEEFGLDIKETSVEGKSLDDLNSDLEQNKGTLDSKNREIEDAKTNYEQKEKDYKEVLESASKSNEQLEILNASRSEKEGEVESQNGMIEEISQVITNQETLVKNIDAELNGLEAPNESQYMTTDSETGEQVLNETEYNKAKAEYEAKKAQLEQDLADAKAELIAQKEEKVKAEEAKLVLEKEVADIDEQIAAETENNKELEELAEKLSEYTEENEKIQKLETEKVQLEENINTIEKAILEEERIQAEAEKKAEETTVDDTQQANEAEKKAEETTVDDTQQASETDKNAGFAEDDRILEDENGQKYVEVQGWEAGNNNNNDCLSKIINNSYDLDSLGVKLYSEDYNKLQNAIMDANTDIYGTEEGGGRQRAFNGERYNSMLYTGDRINLVDPYEVLGIEKPVVEATNGSDTKAGTSVTTEEPTVDDSGSKVGSGNDVTGGGSVSAEEPEVSETPEEMPVDNDKTPAITEEVANIVDDLSELSKKGTDEAWAEHDFSQYSAAELVEIAMAYNNDSNDFINDVYKYGVVDEQASQIIDNLISSIYSDENEEVSKNAEEILNNALNNAFDKDLTFEEKLFLIDVKNSNSANHKQFIDDTNFVERIKDSSLSETDKTNFLTTLKLSYTDLFVRDEIVSEIGKDDKNGDTFEKYAKTFGVDFEYMTQDELYNYKNDYENQIGLKNEFEELYSYFENDSTVLNAKRDGISASTLSSLKKYLDSNGLYGSRDERRNLDMKNSIFNAVEQMKELKNKIDKENENENNEYESYYERMELLNLGVDEKCEDDEDDESFENYLKYILGGELKDRQENVENYIKTASTSDLQKAVDDYTKLINQKHEFIEMYEKLNANDLVPIDEAHDLYYTLSGGAISSAQISQDRTDKIKNSLESLIPQLKNYVTAENSIFDDTFIEEFNGISEKYSDSTKYLVKEDSRILKYAGVGIDADHEDSFKEYLKINGIDILSASENELLEESREYKKLMSTKDTFNGLYNLFVKYNMTGVLDKEYELLDGQKNNKTVKKTLTQLNEDIAQSGAFSNDESYNEDFKNRVPSGIRQMIDYYNQVKENLKPEIRKDFERIINTHVALIDEYDNWVGF